MEKSIPEIIAKKRDGLELSKEEIEFFMQGVVSEKVDKSQIGAMLMAIYLKDLTVSETTCLTRAMMDSGETLQWPKEWAGLLVDKHSTGGVGDKVSLILTPALAACGMKVPMISGRGLGHTGGTLDKLESIPGFQVSVSMERLLEILSTVGCCIVGQTVSLCPADKVLYAIRDVTSTVGHIGLITGSIISKKAAENVNALVLDVKFGHGAFLQDKNNARKLAQLMVDTSKGLGIKTSALLTDMNSPLGKMVGHALEVAESIHALQNKGPEDLTSLVAHLGGHLLANSGNADNTQTGYDMIIKTLKDGSALAKFCAMMKSQGVSSDIADRLCQPGFDMMSILPVAPYKTEIKCTDTGYVGEMNAMVIAEMAQKLGAGRRKAGDKIDLAVGLELLVSVGDKVTKGSPWVKVHHQSKSIPEEMLASLRTALVIQSEKPQVSKANRVVEHLA